MQKVEKSAITLKSKDGKTPDKVLTKNDVENLGADILCPYVATYNINYGEVFGIWMFYAETEFIRTLFKTLQPNNAGMRLVRQSIGKKTAKILTTSSLMVLKTISTRLPWAIRRVAL